MSTYLGDNITALQSTTNPMQPTTPVGAKPKAFRDTYDISGLAAASIVEIYVGVSDPAYVVTDSIRWTMSADPGASVTISIGDAGSATRFVNAADAHAAQTGVATVVSGSRWYLIPSTSVDQTLGGYYLKVTLAGATIAGAVGSGTVLLEVAGTVLDG